MPDRNELIACLRLLLLLTKSHHMATEFVTWGGLPLLLDRFRGAGDDVRGCQVHVIHILRHVEDRAILELLMRRDFIVWFSQPRTRTTDVATFLQHNSHIALRDPAVFIDSCKAVKDFILLWGPRYFLRFTSGLSIGSITVEYLSLTFKHTEWVLRSCVPAHLATASKVADSTSSAPSSKASVASLRRTKTTSPHHLLSQD